MGDRDRDEGRGRSYHSDRSRRDDDRGRRSRSPAGGRDGEAGAFKVQESGGEVSMSIEETNK